MSVYKELGVKTIINAKGTATRLSGGLMHPQVSAAMVQASQSCVDMAELQAAASREIAKATGAEAGYKHQARRPVSCWLRLPAWRTSIPVAWRGFPKRAA